MLQTTSNAKNDFKKIWSYLTKNFYGTNRRLLMRYIKRHLTMGVQHSYKNRSSTENFPLAIAYCSFSYNDSFPLSPKRWASLKRWIVVFMPASHKEFTCNFRQPIREWKVSVSIKRSVTCGTAWLARNAQRGYSFGITRIRKRNRKGNANQVKRKVEICLGRGQVKIYSLINFRLHSTTELFTIPMIIVSTMFNEWEKNVYDS